MTGTLYGYARVSTSTQSLDMQLDALKGAGVSPGNIYQDVISGRYESRPGLDVLLGTIRPNDTLVIWRLDRLGRSLSHLVTLMSDLTNKGIYLKSVTGGLDTSTSTGRMIAGIFASLAEYERELIQERTLAGLEAARQRGVTLGRRPALTPSQVKAAKQLVDSNGMTETARILEVSRTTLWRALAALGKG